MQSSSDDNASNSDAAEAGTGANMSNEANGKEDKKKKSYTPEYHAFSREYAIHMMLAHLDEVSKPFEYMQDGKVLSKKFLDKVLEEKDVQRMRKLQPRSIPKKFNVKLISNAYEDCVDKKTGLCLGSSTFRTDFYYDGWSGSKSVEKYRLKKLASTNGQTALGSSPAAEMSSVGASTKANTITNEKEKNKSLRTVVTQKQILNPDDDDASSMPDGELDLADLSKNLAKEDGVDRELLGTTINTSVQITNYELEDVSIDSPMFPVHEETVGMESIQTNVFPNWANPIQEGIFIDKNKLEVYTVLDGGKRALLKAKGVDLVEPFFAPYIKGYWFVILASHNVSDDPTFDGEKYILSLKPGEKLAKESVIWYTPKDAAFEDAGPSFGRLLRISCRDRFVREARENENRRVLLCGKVPQQGKEYLAVVPKAQPSNKGVYVILSGNRCGFISSSRNRVLPQTGETVCVEICKEQAIVSVQSYSDRDFTNSVPNLIIKRSKKPPEGPKHKTTVQVTGGSNNNKGSDKTWCEIHKPSANTSSSANKRHPRAGDGGNGRRCSTSSLDNIAVPPPLKKRKLQVSRRQLPFAANKKTEADHTSKIDKNSELALPFTRKSYSAEELGLLSKKKSIASFAAENAACRALEAEGAIPHLSKRSLGPIGVAAYNSEESSTFVDSQEGIVSLVMNNMRGKKHLITPAEEVDGRIKKCIFEAITGASLFGKGIETTMDGFSLYPVFCCFKEDLAAEAHIHLNPDQLFKSQQHNESRPLIAFMPVSEDGIVLRVWKRPYLAIDETIQDVTPRVINDVDDIMLRQWEIIVIPADMTHRELRPSRSSAELKYIIFYVNMCGGYTFVDHTIRFNVCDKSSLLTTSHGQIATMSKNGVVKYTLDQNMRPGTPLRKPAANAPTSSTGSKGLGPPSPVVQDACGLPNAVSTSPSSTAGLGSCSEAVGAPDESVGILSTGGLPPAPSNSPPSVVKPSFCLQEPGTSSGSIGGFRAPTPSSYSVSSVPPSTPENLASISTSAARIKEGARNEANEENDSVRGSTESKERSRPAPRAASTLACLRLDKMAAGDTTHDTEVREDDITDKRQEDL